MLTDHRLGTAHSTNGHSAVERFPQVLDQTSHNGSIDSETVDAIRPLCRANAASRNSTFLLDFYFSGKDFFLLLRANNRTVNIWDDLLPEGGVAKLVVRFRRGYRWVEAGLWPEGSGKHSPRFTR